MAQELVGIYHFHSLDDGEREFIKCSAVVVQRVEAPASVVWSLVRRFDEPQIYKPFVRSCFIRSDHGNVKVGCIKEVRVVSNLLPLPPPCFKESAAPWASKGRLLLATESRRQ